jgi:hypothetical protein
LNNAEVAYASLWESEEFFAKKEKRASRGSEGEIFFFKNLFTFFSKKKRIYLHVQANYTEDSLFLTML